MVAAELSSEIRGQRLHAVQHALARYRHDMHLGRAGTDEERVVEFLVSLFFWCDERGVILEDCLHQAERLFVDELEEETRA